MSTTEEEINNVLDGLEEDQGADEQQAGQDNQIDDQADDKQDDKPAEKPPGFKTYDEWVAEGKDPADFRGEEAYKAQYETLKELREVKSTMNHVVTGMETWKQQQESAKAQEIQDAIEQTKADLAKAKDDEDIDAYAEASDKLLKLNKPAPAPVQHSPIITDFAKKNPIVDQNSPQFDKEFHQDMAMIHDGVLDTLLGGDRSKANQLTSQQIERAQTYAYNKAKELHPDKFTSPRNTRQTPANTSRRQPATVDVKTKLKTVTGNPKNPRDTSPANDLYEILKAQDPAVAETFAKNLTGE